MAKRRRRKSRGVWGLFLVFWALLLILFGFLACAYAYRYAAAYEQTRPEKTMDELMAVMSEDDWYAALAPTVEAQTDFEDSAALYQSFFDASVRGRELSYRRDLSYSSLDQTVFTLYSGSTRVGEVRLVPKPGETPQYLGLHEWTLDSITATPLAKSLQAVTVQIDAPEGASVFLNGVQLGAEQISDGAVPMSELSALEQRFSALPTLVRYTVGPLFGQIVVTDGEGQELAPLGAIENGVARYQLRPAETYSFRVEAPAGVVVSVCGAELGEEDVTARESTMFRHLDAYLPAGGYETLHYDCEGLYSQPVITASFQGVELTPVISEDGRFIYFYPTDAAATGDMKDAAEGFFSAYMGYSSYKYKGEALKKLRDRILPGTELDSYFANSYDAMIWASATDVNYEELSFDNYHYVDDNCFTCTILYKVNYTATQWYGEVSDVMRDGFKMVFIRENGSWLAATLSAFDG